MSIEPKALSVASTTALGVAGWVRSPAIERTRVGEANWDSNWDAAAPRAAWSRSLSMTLAPAESRRRAMARPIPRAEPVTRAVWPSRVKGIRVLRLRLGLYGL